MQDSTQTIHLIDTIYKKIYVFDTVYLKTEIHLSDTIKPDLIQVYEHLLTAQDDNFDLILAGVAIIVTVLVVLMAVFNLNVAREFFKKDARKIYKKAQEKFQYGLDKKLEIIDTQMEIRFAVNTSMTHLSLASGAGKIQAIICLVDAALLECKITNKKSGGLNSIINQLNQIISLKILFEQHEIDELKEALVMLVDSEYFSDEKEEIFDFFNNIDQMERS